MSQLRKNIITGEWVVLATERARRPEDYIIRHQIKPTHKKFCVFCVGGEAYAQRIDETKHAYVTPNKYPAFSGDDLASETSSGFYAKMTGSGRHELVVLDKHDQPITQIPAEYWEEIVELFRRRITALNKIDAVKFVMPIYNHQAEGGATIEHPHAQIFGAPIVPHYMKDELKGAQHYFAEHGRCVFCDIIKQERSQAIRMVYENKHFVAFCFYASRFPFETWIMPKTHMSEFEKMNDTEKKFFAECISVTLKKLDKSLKNPPFNFFIHTKPEGKLYTHDTYHWHMEIAPRVSKFGGFELGAGMIINIVAPEAAAEFLRATEV